jgi:GNAT superfamily N-acetyltransferase
MIYRTATEKDFFQLARMRWDFRQESGQETAALSFEEFAEVCVDFLRNQAKNYTYWIAESEGEIVSHIFVSRVALVPRPCRTNDAFGYLTNVYTKPDFRGKNVGSGLLRKVIDWARAEDLELLLVYPSDESVNFYRRSGFKDDKEILKLVLREY